MIPNFIHSCSSLNTLEVLSPDFSLALSIVFIPHSASGSALKIVAAGSLKPLVNKCYTT
jgi:hypothetical protein